MQLLLREDCFEQFLDTGAFFIYLPKITMKEIDNCQNKPQKEAHIDLIK